MKERIILGAKVRLKSESKLMKFINFFIKPFNDSFMTNYWTTIFTTIYAPLSYDEFIDNDFVPVSITRVIEHEKIHIADFKKYHVFFLLTYVFPPAIIAYGRFYWERKAYLPELQELKKNSSPRFESRLERVCDVLSNSEYFWTWPRAWVKKWFLKKLSDQ